jgi:CBS domain-containing protein
MLFYLYLFFMKTAQQILQEKEYKDLISIDPDRPVVDALIIMAEYKIGALVVLKNNKMVGIISERDYAREIILKGKSSKTTNISEIMTKNVLSLAPTDTFEKGLQIMTDNKIRHLPVLKDNEVLGVLSQGDLVKEMIAYQKKLIEQLESFIKN